jgi:hypothetical protein
MTFWLLLERRAVVLSYDPSQCTSASLQPHPASDVPSRLRVASEAALRYLGKWNEWFLAGTQRRRRRGPRRRCLFGAVRPEVSAEPMFDGKFTGPSTRAKLTYTGFKFVALGVPLPQFLDF